MQSLIVFVLAVLTAVFALISWAITADMIPIYRAINNGFRESYFGYVYSFGGSSGPLAVSGVEITIALFIFFFSPALAFFAWRERKGVATIPKWINYTVLVLSVVGFIVSLAQFGVFGNQGILQFNEVAAQAAMFFLTTLLGIAATILPFLPASWTKSINSPRKDEAESGPTMNQASTQPATQPTAQPTQPLAAAEAAHIAEPTSQPTAADASHVAEQSESHQVPNHVA